MQNHNHNLISFFSQSVMARLQMFISSLQNRKEESDELQTGLTQTYYYFWSSNKINQVHENVEKQFCQVIKIGKTLNNASSITLLNSLCDISGVYSTSILSDTEQSIESDYDNVKDDLNYKIYQQGYHLNEVPGLCIKGMTSDNTLTKSAAEEPELIYTCQCHENYGYENCTKVTDPNINGISAGSTYCQTVDTVSLDAGDGLHIIFLDHVVFGKPKLGTTDFSPLNVVRIICLS